MTDDHGLSANAIAVVVFLMLVYVFFVLSIAHRLRSIWRRTDKDDQVHMTLVDIALYAVAVCWPVTFFFKILDIIYSVRRNKADEQEQEKETE